MPTSPGYREAAERLLVGVQLLVEAPVWEIGELIRAAPSAACAAGVYLISSPGSDQAHLYVGRTKSKTIFGRIRDHCGISTPSDLRGMLPRWPDYPQDPLLYRVRWLAVQDAGERASQELFAIAVLSPLFNRP